MSSISGKLFSSLHAKQPFSLYQRQRAVIIPLPRENVHLQSVALHASYFHCVLAIWGWYFSSGWCLPSHPPTKHRALDIDNTPKHQTAA